MNIRHLRRMGMTGCLLTTSALAAMAGAGPARAYLETAARPTITLTAATLGAPTAEVRTDGADVLITPVPASTGPVATFYSVAVRGPDGEPPTVVCDRLVDRPCRDVGAAGSSRSYLITAHLGRYWVRDSDPVDVTAPTLPVPTTTATGPEAPSGPEASSGPEIPDPEAPYPSLTTTPTGITTTTETTTPTGTTTETTTETTTTVGSATEAPTAVPTGATEPAAGDVQRAG